MDPENNMQAQQSNVELRDLILSTCNLCDEIYQNAKGVASPDLAQELLNDNNNVSDLKAIRCRWAPCDGLCSPEPCWMAREYIFYLPVPPDPESLQLQTRLLVEHLLFNALDAIGGEEGIENRIKKAIEVNAILENRLRILRNSDAGSQR
jgi:hypothetical protein